MSVGILHRLKQHTLWPHLYMKATTSMAIKSGHVVVTKAWIESRCHYWRTTVNLIRSEVLYCTITCLVDDKIVVIARCTVVELEISSRLNNQHYCHSILIVYTLHTRVSNYVTFTSKNNCMYPMLIFAVHTGTVEHLR